MGFSLLQPTTPSTPATKRLMIDNVFSDAEPDTFDDLMTK
jgi:hypothetical protein